MQPDDDIPTSIHDRVKVGVKAVFEQLLEQEMTQHLQAEYRERTQGRRGERNGHRQRDLITPVGRMSNSKSPEIEGEFPTEVLERYKRMTGDLEEAVLEMYFQGVSTRRVSSITQAISMVRVSKDAVSRITKKLDVVQGGEASYSGAGGIPLGGERIESCGGCCGAGYGGVGFTPEYGYGAA